MSNQSDLKLLYVADSWSTFQYPEYRKPDGVRNEFQRDRDRILYCSAFRRLAGKTQVFASGLHDHIRTRLTHTIEVSQIARTITRELHLNEDLSEAIALGHDLGHTPFGHVGENVLKYITSKCDSLGKKIEEGIISSGYQGFKHNLQSLRVVSDLERQYDEHNGLNLTSFVRWGIYSHSKIHWKPKCNMEESCIFHEERKCKFKKIDRFPLDFYNDVVEKLHKPMMSVEARIVAMADEISQRHHDLEDGIYAGLMTHDEALSIVEALITKTKLISYDKSMKKLRKDLKHVSKVRFTSILARIMVDCLIRELIDSTKPKLEKLITDESILSVEDYKRWLTETNARHISQKIDKAVDYGDEFAKAEAKLQKTLKNRILKSFVVERMDGKAKFILRQIWKAYLTNPQQLSDRVILRLIQHVNIPPFRNVSRLTKTTISEKVGRAREALDSIRSNPDYYKELKRALVRELCDFISGMTDEMAMEEHRRLYSSHENVAELR